MIDSEIYGDGGEPSGSRIAVVVEPGPRGAAAVVEAAELGASSDSELTVVAVAPKVGIVCRSCGGVSTRAYNCAVRDDVADEVDKAVARLVAVTQRLKGKLLVEGSDPPLEHWVAQGRFDVVLLPPRWGVPRSRRHPAARLLRRHTDATIRVVQAPRRHAGTRA